MSLLQMMPLVAKTLVKRNLNTTVITLPDERVFHQRGLIDSTHLAGYNACIGWQQQQYLSPTYLHVLASSLHMQLLLHAKQPFALLGLVHIANQIEHLRPVQSNENISLQSYLANLQPHPRGWCFDIVTEAKSENELVWREVSTNLSRGKSQTKAKSQPIVLPEVMEPYADVSAANDTGRHYAHYSGDYNPIHLYPILAKCFGFKRHIAHGMWSKARCLAALAAELPEDFIVTVNFTRPLFLPGNATLRYTATKAQAYFELRSSQASHLRATIKNITAR